MHEQKDNIMKKSHKILFIMEMIFSVFAFYYLFTRESVLVISIAALLLTAAIAGTIIYIIKKIKEIKY